MAKKAEESLSIGTTLVLDMSYLAWANSCAMSKLSTRYGKKSGAFYGTMRQVRSFLSMFEPLEIFGLWDVGSSWRKTISETYKGNRQPPPEGESLYAQFADIRLALKYLGVHSISAKGFEADDIAAYLVHKGPPVNCLTLVSGDGDWKQLVNHGVDLYDPRAKKLVTVENYREVTGFSEPYHFLLSKTVMGDPSDNINGLDNIGPVRMKEYLRKTAAPEITARIDSFLESQDGRNNMTLIQLLSPVMTEDSQLSMEHGSWEPEIFKEVSQSYECKSFLEPSWSAGFEQLHARLERSRSAEQPTS